MRKIHCFLNGGFKIFIVMTFLFMALGNSSQVSAETQRTTHTPWSGYWWPYNKCGLADGNTYYGHPSPLEKYELYTEGFYPRGLSNWYRATYCSESYPSWYGHCGHWALAAAWENYEIFPSVIDNIIFRVGDKKGLLTMMHTQDIAIWGDGTKAEQFHLWLLKYIKDEKRAFVADTASGEEVWQYPIYKYDMTSVVSGLTESVTVQVYAASDFVHPDFMGTEDNIFNYTYNLTLNGNGEITGAQWTGGSVEDHPEKMYIPLVPGTVVPETVVPLLDYELVKTIARSKDDSLENGSNNVTISPGTYNLILLDEDRYLLDAESGAVLSVDLTLLEGGGDEFNFILTDSASQVVQEFMVSDESPARISISAENPPYMIQVFKDSYETPGIYKLEYDTFRTVSTTIPYVPKDGKWSGFAVTNYGEASLENVELTSYTKEGKALQTLLGPLEMAPGEKKLFIFGNLPYHQHELSAVDSVRISASSISGMVNLIGSGDGVTSLVQGRYKGFHLVLPDTVMEMQSNKSMFGSILNESDIAADVTITLYNAQGLGMTSVDITLEARQSYFFRPGASPFYSMPDSGWMDIQTHNEEIVLSGFQYLKEGESIETNFAVPVTDANKIVPHIPLAGKWETQLVLINTSDTKAKIVLHRVMAGSDTQSDIPLELESKSREALNLHDLFETNPVGEYYRSILSVASDQPLSGYYAYKSIDYDDNVTIPLLEPTDFSSKLLLPHNTQNGSWWTGVGLLNPGAGNITIMIKPYGKAGVLISELVHDVTLDAGEYYIFNMEKLFEEHVFDIAFVRFETEDSNNIIGGFYLFGSKEDGLCGANLQPITD